MTGNSPLVFVVAGEPSGDLLGGGLMAALRRQTRDRVRFAGIGGPKMIEQGLVPLFPMDELSVMGLAEILPRIPDLLRRIDQTVGAVKHLRPDALVTIDAPDFSFRVARRLRDTDVPKVHYVAPSVWAWRPGRAAKIAGFLDHLLALLPFEPPYFERVGLPCSFIGHPAIEGPAGRGDGTRFRQRHGLPSDVPVLTMLPGSRQGEVDRLLPVFRAAVDQLRTGGASFALAVPVGSHVVEKVRSGLSGSSVPAIIIDTEDEKFDAFAASTAALAKSGTVTLELALSRVPTVIAYKVNPLSYAIASRMAVGKFVGLPNIVLDRPLMPELLQQECSPDQLCRALKPLLSGDTAERRAQLDGMAEVRKRMTSPGLSPSDAAGEIVLRIARERAEGRS